MALLANVCPMWNSFIFFTEINNDFGKTSYYEHFRQIHFQNTYTEIAALLQQGECKVCTVTKVRLYSSSSAHPVAHGPTLDPSPSNY